MRIAGDTATPSPHTSNFTLQAPFVVFAARTQAETTRARARIHPDLKDSAMNWDQIEGNWKQMKGKVKAQWGKLTDDHLDVIAGKRDQLSGKIQEQYGYTKERAEQELDAWLKDHPSTPVETPSKH